MTAQQPIGTAKGPGEKPHEYTFLTPDRDNAVKVGEFVYYRATVDGAETGPHRRVVQRRPARLFPDEFSADPLVPPALVASSLGYQLLRCGAVRGDGGVAGLLR